MDEEPEERIPPLRLALALLLGGSILFMTYVIFDPDLGTEVPVFQEFTCRDTLQLVASNGYGGPELQVPESAVRLNASGDGQPRPVLVIIMMREGAGAWTEFHRAQAPSGSGVWFVAPTTTETTVRFDVRDLEGKYCAASVEIRPAA